MRSVTAGVCALAVVALVVVALLQRTALAFTLGVAAALPAIVLDHGQEACQTPIAVPPDGDFDRVVMAVGAAGPGPQLGVRVRAVDGGRVLSSGTLPAGYRGEQPLERTVRVRRVPSGSRIALCVVNQGTGKVTLYGNPEAASRTSSLTVAGQPTGMDMTLRFERAPRSMASLLGAMADRAALFKLSWVGGWTFWLLGALVLLAVPVLLTRAVRGALE